MITMGSTPLQEAGVAIQKTLTVFTGAIAVPEPKFMAHNCPVG